MSPGYFLRRSRVLRRPGLPGLRGTAGLGDGRPPMRGRYEWENYALGFATFSSFADFVAPVQDGVRSALIKNQVILPGSFDR